jgi:anti-sigma factor RsiW
VTLTCAVLVEQVTAYLDGSLERDDENRFVSHLAECAGCATYVEQCRETIRLVGTLPPDSVAAPARDHLLAAFRERRRRG